MFVKHLRLCYLSTLILNKYLEVLKKILFIQIKMYPKTFIEKFGVQMVNLKAFSNYVLSHILQENMKSATVYKTWIFAQFSPTRPHWAELVIELPCLSVCLFAPSNAFFYEASHWPSGHMTRSWPLIGQPPPAPP